MPKSYIYMSPDYLHRKYTGFSWDEIKEIAKAIRKVAKQGEEKWPDGFEYPDYGGLPKKIYKRLTRDQVYYIQQLFDYGTKPLINFTLNQLSRELARGR